MDDVEDFGMGKKEETYVPQVTDQKKPKEGQGFNSLDDTYNFYNKYAWEVGFSVRIEKSKKKKGTDETYWKQFVCYKEGETNETHKRKKEKEKILNENVEINFRKVVRQRGKIREGCKAKLTAVQRGPKYVISQFIEGHNHPLATPTKVHLLRSHRKVSDVKKVLAQQFASANVPTHQQFDILEAQAGGFQNVGCTERDIRNYERDMREKYKGHDADLLNEYFKSKQEKNPAYFFEFERDEIDRMTRCFWADPIAIRAYNFFGDVVVFDTTYNTNRYSMIFAPLTGVNHHGQTIIFGCGFLSDETTESFIWLFEKWLKAMPKGPPIVIITDQDPAMAKAIAQALPNTFHRYCIWHILKNFSEKLDSIVYREHYHHFKECIWDPETEEEFEECWKDVLEKSKQQGNDWLKKMYAMRDKWVPAYVNTFFCAGMSSSQRVESSHAFFKRYCSKNNSLMDFITRFNKGLAHIRHQELIADHADINEKPNVRSLVPMEMQMMGVYTKKYFHVFQNELYESNAYLINIAMEDEHQCVYKVERLLDGDPKKRQLVYDKSSDFVKCSCRHIEFEGIPCRHLLAFFRVKQILILPKQYVMQRFTRNARVGSVIGQDGMEIKDVKDKSLLMRRTKLSQLASIAIDEASILEEGTKLLTNALETVIEKVKVMNTSRGGEGLSEKIDIPEQRTFNDPLQVRAKGCGKRLKSSKEKAMGKLRHCHGCGKLGQSHDKRNCPKLTNRSTINSDEDSSCESQHTADLSE